MCQKEVVNPNTQSTLRAGQMVETRETARNTVLTAFCCLFLFLLFIMFTGSPFFPFSLSFLFFVGTDAAFWGFTMSVLTPRHVDAEHIHKYAFTHFLAQPHVLCLCFGRLTLAASC
jgi:hypothetical protein